MSSLLLVANRIDATNAAMMTGTTTNGEEMCIARSPYRLQITKWRWLIARGGSRDTGHDLAAEVLRGTGHSLALLGVTVYWLDNSIY